jgi:outer membrane murein-binding lipoprotein Lpp
MSPEDIQALERQNVYLKQRCAQLEGDVSDLGAQVARLSQQLERIAGRRPTGARGDPLSGGQ